MFTYSYGFYMKPKPIVASVPIIVNTIKKIVNDTLFAIIVPATTAPIILQVLKIDQNIPKKKP